MPTILHGYTNREVDPGVEKADLITQTQIGLKHALDVNVLGGSISITVGKDVPAIYNLTSPAIGTEFSQALSSGTKSFLIRVRGTSGAELQMGFSSGFTNYVTIPRGNSFKEDGLDLTSTTIYLKCNKAGETIEILEWT